MEFAVAGSNPTLRYHEQSMADIRRRERAAAKRNPSAPAGGSKADWSLESATVLLAAPDPVDGSRRPIVMGPMGPILVSVGLPADVTPSEARNFVLSNCRRQVLSEARHVPGTFDW